MKRKIIKTVLALLGIIVVLLVVIYLVAWKSPQYYKTSTVFNPADPVIPFAQYNPEHARPFIISGSAFTLFGATHTRDPKQPEIKMIEEEWKKLRPTVALVEGRLGFLLPGFMDPVETLGEGGKLMQLSRKAKVKIYNWDLSKKAIAGQMKNKFSTEQIALAQILNPYFSQLRFGRPTDPGRFISEYMKRAAYVNEEENFKTIDDIDRVWKKYFPSGKDWRDTSDETELPGYLSGMMAYGNDLRNQQLVTVIKELVSKGERPFVLCGSSHAVCVAPAFQ